MQRFQGNPILEPVATHPWESRRVFNAAAVIAEKRVHILYRAMGDDGVSRLGYAATLDGYHVDERLPHPVLEPGGTPDRDGCEDPRLTLLDNKLLLTYTALQELDHQQIYQISLTSIDIEDFLRKQWKWENRRLPFPGIRNKDAVIFPKVVDGEFIMFHRIEPDICIARSKDLNRWYDIKSVMAPRTKSWDCWKVGAAGPPIELNEGWLFIYHGVNFERVYSLGAAMLEKNNPETVLYRSERPILTPTEDYERFGKVPKVVFSCGNVVIDDKILIYYGGADSVVCVATYELSELVPRK